MTKTGLADRIGACESLLEKGSAVDALVGLLCLRKETAAGGEADTAPMRERFVRLTDRAFKACEDDYAKSRNKPCLSGLHPHPLGLEG